MKREWYFVRWLNTSSTPEVDRRFEVQVLDNEGRAVAFTDITVHTIDLAIEGRIIPRAVIDAAKKYQGGQGDYVGPDGISMPPF